MSPRRRVALVLVGAFAFGLFAAWAKGPATDGLSVLSQLRSSLGNLSTPWLLAAFIAGTSSPRLLPAALLGLAATMVALVGFYLLTSQLVNLGGHGFLGDLGKELSANRAYLEGGLVTGPVFGALGSWWGRTRSLRSSVMAGALMMGEPLVLALVGAVFSGGVFSSGALPDLLRIVPGWGLTADRSAISIAVYCSEFGLGLAVLLVALRRSPKQPRRTATISVPESTG